jgi:hypothetical protein
MIMLCDWFGKKNIRPAPKSFDISIEEIDIDEDEEKWARASREVFIPSLQSRRSLS